jgi:hypothetical protein
VPQIDRTRLLALAVAALLAGAPAATAADYLEMTTLSSEHVAVLNRTGLEASALIAEARRKIDTGKSRAAVHDVGRARQILLEARGISPAVTLGDKIADAVGIIRESPEPNALLPVYAQIDAYKAQDVMLIRGKVDAAKAALAKGDGGTAEAELYAAVSEIDYMEVDLPIHDALASVNRALMLLHRKDNIGAKAALDNALSHVEVVTAVVKRDVGEIRETGM